MKLAVFLVEDDPVLRDQLTELIKHQCGARIVASADTEREAASWLATHPNEWQLVVLDLFLKDGTGFGVLATTHSMGKRHVVVLTNSATAENRSRCLEMGASAVFDKTTEIPEFLDHCSGRGKHSLHHA